MKTLIASTLVLFMSLTVSAQNVQNATTNGAVRLFADKDDLTSVMTIIPAGSTVEVIKPDVEYTLIRFDNNEGYIKSDRITMQAPVISPAPIYPPGYGVSQPQAQTQSEPQPADRYEMLVTKYGTDIGKRLYQHKVWKGVSADMARDSWGKPTQINRMYVDQSVDEEWIYSKKWLYFRDGTLIDWGAVK